jgi:hypothetical protein
MPKWPVALAIAILPAAALAGAFKYHDISGTLVSADAKTSMCTIKFDDGSTGTGKAEGDALKALAGLKAGDKISVTCKDNEKGEHLSATAIKALK